MCAPPHTHASGPVYACTGVLAPLPASHGCQRPVCAHMWALAAHLLALVVRHHRACAHFHARHFPSGPPTRKDWGALIYMITGSTDNFFLLKYWQYNMLRRISTKYVVYSISDSGNNVTRLYYKFRLQIPQMKKKINLFYKINSILRYTKMKITYQKQLD